APPRGAVRAGGVTRGRGRLHAEVSRSRPAHLLRLLLHHPERGRLQPASLPDLSPYGCAGSACGRSTLNPPSAPPATPPPPRIPIRREHRIEKLFNHPVPHDQRDPFHE